MKRLPSLLLAAALATCTSNGFAETIAPGTTYSQNFNAIGNSSTATLPSGWTVNSSTGVRDVTTALYTGAGTATEAQGSGSGTSGAIYNYGDAADTSDRGIGFLATGSACKTGNLYLTLTASGAIPNFSVSYDMKCYRNNKRQYQFQLYYSTDNGTTWTSAGASFNTTYAVATSGGPVNPAGVTSVSSQTLNVSLSAGQTIIFCWSYSVPSGTDTTNAQGLGIDNVVIVAGGMATPALSAPDNLAVDGDVGTTEFTVTWDAVTDASGYTATLYDEYGSNEITSFGLYAGDETATFTGLSASTTYLVSVVANGDGINFVDSTAATNYVTTADPAFSLTTPYYLTVDENSITPVSFTASWTGDPNAEEYEVEAFEARTITIDFDLESVGGSTWVDNKSGSVEISPMTSITWTASSGRVYGTDSLESPDDVPNPALTIKSGETLTIGPLDGYNGLTFRTKKSGGNATATRAITISLDRGDGAPYQFGSMTVTGGIAKFTDDSDTSYTGPCSILITVASGGTTPHVVIDDIELGTFVPVSDMPFTTSSESCQVSGLSADTDYYWRVRATGDGTATDWATSDSLVHTRANQMPVLSLTANGTPGASSITIATNTTLTVVLSASDPDGDAIAEYFMGSSNLGSLSGNTFTWTPTEAQAVQFGFYAIDEYNGWSDEVTLSVTVLAPGAKPVVTVTPASATATAGEAVSATVATDKGALNAPTAPQGVAATDYTFNSSTGAFTFTPPTLGSFTFTFTATDATDGTSDPTSFTVTANALPAPTGVEATDVGQTGFTATWDSVPGASSYEVALYKIVPHTLDFTGAGVSGNANIFVAFNGAVDGIAWDTALGRINEFNANNAVNIDGETLALSKSSGTLYFGPFTNGVKEVALKYQGATTSDGLLAVELVDSSTNVVESLATGLATHKGTVVTTNFFAATPYTFAGRILRITATENAAAVDDIVVSAFEPQGSSQTVNSGTSLPFTGLTQATDYLVSVTAVNGATASSVAQAVLTTGGNHAPTLSLSATSTNTVAGAEVSVTLVGDDRDGDALTYAVSPVDYAANLVGNVFTWTPTSVGTTILSFTASDGQTTSEAATFTVVASLAVPTITSAVATECDTASITWTTVSGADGYRVGAVGTVVRGTMAIRETFDGFTNYMATTALDSYANDYMDNTGWTLANAYRGNASSTDHEAGSVAKFGGGSSAKGSLESPALDLSGNEGDFVVMFDARRWKGDKTTLDILLSGTVVTNIVLTDVMETYIMSISGGTAGARVAIEGHAANNNRFFLDNLRIVSGTVTTQTVAQDKLSLSGTTCTATGLTPDATYTFTVTAYVDGDEETTSASVSVSTPEAPARTLIIFR